ncbi:MAG: S-adenosylmethionine decarboxylase proenzyme [FCB group bacterium]|nr:S-adenosylmethionine decarboxylase proenzyme [FCB group bacterium]
MKKLGQHLLAEFTGCDTTTLNSLDKIKSILIEAARQSGATIVNSVFHHYNPHGLSGVVVIAESHMSIHTWPEYGYAAVDFFTCGERVDPWKACHYMKEHLGSSDMQTREILRGLPGGKDEVLPHKPAAQPSEKREVA